MRKALSIAATWGLATALATGQDLPPPIPGEETREIPTTPQPEAADPAPAPPAEAAAEEVAPKPAEAAPTSLQAVRLPVGVRPAKPIISSTEKLIRDSEKSLAEGDQFWMTVEHAGGAGVTTVDIDHTGMCHLIERRVVDGEPLPTFVRAGRGIPEATRNAMLTHARTKGILFGLGQDRLVSGGAGERMRLGVAARLGRSVHSSNYVEMEQYPVEAQRAAFDLLEAARALPVVGSAKAVVSAEFVPPQQARRQLVLGGGRLIGVLDPGPDATTLSPEVAAARMPGRRVVVADPLEWERIRGYVTNGGREPEPAASCLISVGAQVYRLSVEVLGAR